MSFSTPTTWLSRFKYAGGGVSHGTGYGGREASYATGPARPLPPPRAVRPHDSHNKYTIMLVRLPAGPRFCFSVEPLFLDFRSEDDRIQICTLATKNKSTSRARSSPRRPRARRCRAGRAAAAARRSWPRSSRARKTPNSNKTYFTGRSYQRFNNAEPNVIGSAFICERETIQEFFIVWAQYNPRSRPCSEQDPAGGNSAPPAP